jgi:FtsP/CotA-like multicopper oxidase with cupredoxin domain
VRGNGRRFAGLAEAPVTAQRTVFFAENNPAGEFYMTVQGQANRLYNPNMPPGIVTTKGAVEQWTVQNRTQESHEFHIHQIHFLVRSQNFQPQAPAITGQYLDMIDLPPWSGSGPYPSVTLLMDFRGAVVGSFVFHCHILNHEDGGMMNIVQVNAGPTQSSGKSGSRSP